MSVPTNPTCEVMLDSDEVVWRYGTVSLCGLGGGQALLECVQLERIRCVPALQQREHLRERARKALAQQIHANILTREPRETPQKRNQEWMGLMVGISNNHLTNYNNVLRTTINLTRRGSVFSLHGILLHTFRDGPKLNQKQSANCWRQNVSVLALISRAYLDVGVFLCLWGL